METLNIEKFNPTKAEIVAMVGKYKELSITGVDDKVGYEAVHRARIELKSVRVNITKTGKAMREEALKFQKEVIAKEKELVDLVEPTERDLEAKQKTIDEEKEKVKRLAILPARKEKLQAINVRVEDDFLLLMDDARFFAFFNEKNAEFLEEKERLMREEQEKIEASKRALEEAKRLEEAKKQADKEAQERALRDAEIAKARAEQEKQDAIAQERARAEEEKQKLIEEQHKKEQDRLAQIEKAKQEEADRAAVEKAAQEKLEKQKKYQSFLKSHGYTEANQADFHIERTGNDVTLYKKVGEFTV